MIFELVHAKRGPGPSADADKVKSEDQAKSEINVIGDLRYHIRPVICPDLSLFLSKEKEGVVNPEHPTGQRGTTKPVCRLETKASDYVALFVG